MELEGDRVASVFGRVLDRESGRGPTGPTVRVRAEGGGDLSGGAINSPALLLRSGPTPAGAGWAAAPGCTRWCCRGRCPNSGSKGSAARPSRCLRTTSSTAAREIGFYLEGAPVHPMLGAGAYRHRVGPAQLDETPAVMLVTIVLHLPMASPTTRGAVRLARGRAIRLHYPLLAARREAAIDALGKMARMQLAAGAAR